MNDRKLLISASLANAAVFAADIHAFYACLRGLGANATVPASLIAFILASIVGTLGPIPFGLGT